MASYSPNKICAILNTVTYLPLWKGLTVATRFPPPVPLFHFFHRYTMVGEAPVLETVSRLITSYSSLVQKGVKLQKALEAYYLREEASIRKRVALIDELQACIADERRCLELQHQECRTQISSARRSITNLQSDHNKTSEVCKQSPRDLEAEERRLDEELVEVTKALASENALLHELLTARDSLENLQKALETKERQQTQEEQDMDRALLEIKRLASEIEYRKLSLCKKDKVISEWNQSLEQRERETIRCQEELREELKLVELDECQLGLKTMGAASPPSISQHEVLDNNDMSIEHEHNREEIDLEDGEDTW